MVLNVLSLKPLDYQLHNLFNQAMTNEELVSKFKATLKQYYLLKGGAQPANEVGEYLRELACPFFLHEFVKQAVVMSIEMGPDAEPLFGLMKHLNSTYGLARIQIIQGMRKAQKYVESSLSIDVPPAPAYLETIKVGL